MRVVVVGSGLAGLVVALRASRRHAVTLLTKADLVESTTRYAQGGIAAGLSPDDVDAHIADTIAAGAGLCTPEAVRALCTAGPERIEDLIALGVRFDTAAGSPDRTTEGAHSAPRILHAGGDQSGRAIMRALGRRLRDAPVQVSE
ncbi:MAG: FAD-dependent oxidoreductase, partial [Promicromonosporaceae bacterium]|nr:FAD-dependent oxidoreductase [Promicromonosporaceae bacterium]